MGAFRPHFLLLLVLVAVPNISSAPPAGSEDATKLAAKANTRFAFDLMKSLMQTEGNGKNIFFSPYSISAALAMTSLGAAGKTLAEIDKTFHFDQVNTNGNKFAIHEVYKNLIELYNAGNANYSLSTANKLFGDNTFDVLPSFQNNAQKYYHAELQQLDFKSGQAEGVINEWVEDQTNKKIKDLIAAGSLRDAVMVLVNAIYFKGTWLKQFDAKATKKEDFYLSANQKKRVDMMKVTTNFNYAHDSQLKAKVLEMPYTGEQLSMIVILPDEIDGLPAVIQKLTDDKFGQLLESMSSQKVEVSFPKFKLETEYSLVSTLDRLGIHDLFSDRCDLSDVNPHRLLQISKVLHRAVLEVDEEGSEAAASTAVDIIPFSLVFDKVSKETFLANKPFLFAIISSEHDQNGNKGLAQIDGGGDEIHFNMTQNVLFVGVLNG